MANTKDEDKDKSIIQEVLSKKGSTFTGNVGSLFKTVAGDFFTERKKDVDALVKGDVTIKDVLNEVPQATGKVAKGVGNLAADIVRAPIRFSTSGFLSLGEYVSGREQSVELQSKAEKLIFGVDEVKTFQKSSREGRETIEALGGDESAQKYLPPALIAFGGTLDLFGFGKPVKKAADPVFDAIVKETSEEGVKTLLRQNAKALDSTIVDKLAPSLAKADNVEDVKRLIDEGYTRRLSNSTVGEIADDIAPKSTRRTNVAEPSNDMVTEAIRRSESTNTRSFDINKPTIKTEVDAIPDDIPAPLRQIAVEAKKYETAEEFIQAINKSADGRNYSFFATQARKTDKGLQKALATEAKIFQRSEKVRKDFIKLRGQMEAAGKTAKQIEKDPALNKLNAEYQALGSRYQNAQARSKAEAKRVNDTFERSLGGFSNDSDERVRAFYNSVKSETQSPKTQKGNASQLPEGSGTSIAESNAAVSSPYEDKTITLNTERVTANAGENVSISTATGGFFDKKVKELKNTEPYLRAQEFLQDNWTRVKRVMEREGVTFSDESNPYQKQQLFHGIVGALNEDLDRRVRVIEKSIVSRAGKNKIKAEEFRADVNSYLHARHALERNAVLEDGAAGMKSVEAQDLLDTINGKAYAREVQEVADEIQAMNDEVLDILLDGEIITRELYDTLKDRYKTHVPLNRVLEGEGDQAFNDILTSRGLNVRGQNPIKKAVGSDKEVRDITGNIIANYKQAIERAEKNKVNIATYRMAQENDMFGGLFAEPKAPVKPIRTVDGEEAFVRDFGSFDKDEMILKFRLGGEQKYLQVNDARLAKAFSSVNVERVPDLLRPIAIITRFYAGMATRFNPEFAFSNIIRDTQDLAVNSAAMQGAKASVKNASRVPKSAKDITDWLRGKESEGAKLYAQMRKDGGTTGGLGLSTREQIEVDLERVIKEANSKPRKVWANLIRSVDSYNRVFEDATRLSAYKTALDQGKTRQQAAFIAKNVTVNFNNRGTASPIINSLWMFTNASVQGNVRTIKSLANPKVAAVVIGTMYGITEISQSRNDSIDPDWRDKISPYDRNHSLVFVLNQKEGSEFAYVTIPVSWGMKPIKVLTERMYELSHGIGQAGDAVEDIATSLAGAYNPIGGSDFFSTVTPTVLDVPAEIARNKAWHGGIIFPDWKKGLPAPEQVFDSTKETLKGRTAIEISELMNKIGIEMTPPAISYTYDQFVGGAGRAATRAFDTVGALATGSAADANPTDLFLINRFLKVKEGEQVERQVRKQNEERLYDELKDERDPFERKDLIRDYVRDMDTEDAQRIMFILRDQGFDTKGVKYSDNPRKPSITRDKETGERLYPTFDDWYGYYRSPKFNHTREEARELAEGMTKGQKAPIIRNEGAETTDERKARIEEVLGL